jgi:hypothetical protein
VHGKISLFSLVLLIVAAIDRIRTLPMTAIFGSSLTFFFLVSAVIFLIPISLISAEFTSRYHDKEAFFIGLRHAFGEKIGVMALASVDQYDGLVSDDSFVCSRNCGSYLYDPALAGNKLFLVSVILTVFLGGLTFFNLFGIHLSSRVNSI